jgi:hypothetical protein
MMLAMKSLSFGLRPKAPFRLDLTAWALRRRRRNIVDLWDATTYQRILEIGGIPLKVAVRQVGSSEHPRLHISVTGRKIHSDARNSVVAALVRILGLRTDLTDFYALAARHGTAGHYCHVFGLLTIMISCVRSASIGFKQQGHDCCNPQ